MKNTEYRKCFKSDTEPECPFADFNRYRIHCCTIDCIVQTRWYGCVPQAVIDRLDDDEELKQ